MRYTIQHSYRSFSDGQQRGPWEAGETVELDDDAAAWLERDSPGLLTPVQERGGREAKSPANRQQRGGGNR